MKEIDTERGARICLQEPVPHLGDGVVLSIRMQDPTDRRWASVKLSPHEMDLLVEQLADRLFEINERR